MLLCIFCPNECLFRVSSKRAGRVIRCPKCKMAIRIPRISSLDPVMGQPVPCYARVARKKTIADSEGFHDVELGDDLGRSFIQSDSMPRLPLPGFTKPVIRKRCNIAATEFDDFDSDGLDWFGSGSSWPSVIAREKSTKQVAQVSVAKQAVPPTNQHAAAKNPVTEPEDLRYGSSRQELPDLQESRVSSWRLMFAVAISLVAVFNLTLSLADGVRWAINGIGVGWTNWMSVQVLSGGLQIAFVYFWIASLRRQTIRFLAPVMLLASFSFGLVSAQFLLAGSTSRLAGVLGVSAATIGVATFGSVLNLCATTLACYFCFHEPTRFEDQEMSSAQTSFQRHEA